MVIYMKNNPIAFFDSGIGGSTILKEVMKSLPHENYIYYPDSVNNLKRIILNVYGKK